MARVEIKVDHQRALALSRAAVGMLEKRLPPFDVPNLFPDAIVPTGVTAGSLEHSLFLFHSVSIDSMRQADQVYSAMRAVSDYFGGDLSKLAEIDRAELEKVLIPFLGKGIETSDSAMTDPVGTLLGNAKKLKADYQGDPRNILKKGEVWKTIAGIDKFRQYGVPKAALLMKNYVKAGMWPFTEFEIPIKVDRHVMRMSLSCGVINAQDYAEQIDWQGEIPKALDTARKQLTRIGHYTEEDFKTGNVKLVRAGKFILPLTHLYQRITDKERISAINLDDATWAIGARLCKLNDGVFCATSCHLNCPTRYPSDNNALWFFLDIDKRKDPINLFNYNFAK